MNCGYNDDTNGNGIFMGFLLVKENRINYNQEVSSNQTKIKQNGEYNMNERQKRFLAVVTISLLLIATVGTLASCSGNTPVIENENNISGTVDEREQASEYGDEGNPIGDTQDETGQEAVGQEQTDNTQNVNGEQEQDGAPKQTHLTESRSDDDYFYIIFNYNENGIRIKSTYYTYDDVLLSISEYDEQGRLLKASKYEENGDLSEYEIYEYEDDDTFSIRWYDAHGNLTRTYDHNG